jgi:DNA excision repair protein ERCC-2
MMNNYRETCLASARKVKKKLCVEPRSSEEVPNLLDEFFRLGTKGGGVLLGVCGGKLAEGIDYKGQALNGVAVVGLPLGVFDEIQKEVNAYYTRKYGKIDGMLIAYTLPAINRGLQAAGRVIRAESERGVLLFCDRRFGNSGMGGVNHFLPEWVSKELIVADASEGRKMIQAKLAEWKHDMGSETKLTCNQPSGRRGPGKKGTRDLKALARSLGMERIVKEKPNSGRKRI